MATTTNYGWDTPDDTDLVKDGAAAIRTLGSSVDTTTKNLNPETTLGDLAFRSATSNVNTRLGIGSTGQVLTVAAGVPSWATPSSGALTLVSNGSFTAASSFNLGTPFTSSYRNYKVLISLVNTAANSNPGIYCSPRVGGVNNVSGGVDFTYRFYSSNATTDSTNTNQNYVQLGNFLDDGWSLDMTIYQPNISGKTFARYLGIAGNGGSGTVNGQYEGAFTVQANTQWDSLGFTLSGDTYTGFYRVYGLAD